MVLCHHGNCLSSQGECNKSSMQKVENVTMNYMVTLSLFKYNPTNWHVILVILTRRVAVPVHAKREEEDERKCE